MQAIQFTADNISFDHSEIHPYLSYYFIIWDYDDPALEIILKWEENIIKKTTMHDLKILEMGATV